jgi:pyridoxal phosphate enzyme (YggS family)
MRDRINKIFEKIEAAAKKTGRKRDDITLVAVSKTFSIEKIKEAYDCGLRIFGESRIQEAKDKVDKLRALNDIKFHLIGHIQTNKIRFIDDYFEMIHSLDSLYLAEKLDNFFRSIGKVQDVLIQVNLVNEPQKYGIRLDDYPKLIDKIKSLPHLRLRGLMFIPPFYENPELNRDNFRNMKKLFDETKVKNPDFNNFNILSMGMSDDFEIAIEEGSSMVRIGTAIFGER